MCYNKRHYALAVLHTDLTVLFLKAEPETWGSPPAAGNLSSCGLTAGLGCRCLRLSIDLTAAASWRLLGTAVWQFGMPRNPHTLLGTLLDQTLPDSLFAQQPVMLFLQCEVHVLHTLSKFAVHAMGGALFVASPPRPFALFWVYRIGMGFCFSLASSCVEILYQSRKWPLLHKENGMDWRKKL